MAAVPKDMPAEAPGGLLNGNYEDLWGRGSLLYWGPPGQTLFAQPGGRKGVPQGSQPGEGEGTLKRQQCFKARGSRGMREPLIPEISW